MSGGAASAAWIALARLGRPQGRKGEITAVSLSSYPERLREVRRVFLFAGEGEGVEFEVENVWPRRAEWVIKFRGVDSINDAERWRGAEVRIPVSERSEAPEGGFFLDDLIGCRVVAQATGEEFGQVTGWEEGGGHVLLAVGEDVLIPFAKRLCPKVDVVGRVIEVDLPEGLLDLNRR